MFFNKPKNRAVGSVFALTYSFRLRSCKLVGAFIISPLEWSKYSNALKGHGFLRWVLRTKETTLFRRLRSEKVALRAVPEMVFAASLGFVYTRNIRWLRSGEHAGSIERALPGLAGRQL